MTWVRLDDSKADAPELVAAGPLAFAIALWAVSYSARHLTDGRIDIGVLKGCPWVTRRSALDRACGQLEVAGFWTRTDGAYEIVDPFQYLQKSDEVKEKRAANAARQAAWRERQRDRRNAPRNGVTRKGRNAPPDPTPKGEGRPSADASPKGRAPALRPPGSPPAAPDEPRFPAAAITLEVRNHYKPPTGWVKACRDCSRQDVDVFRVIVPTPGREAEPPQYNYCRACLLKRGYVDEELIA